MDKLRELIDDLFSNDRLIAVLASGPRRRDKDSPRRITARLITSKQGPLWQFEYRYEQKATHRNLPPVDAKPAILELAENEFTNLQLFAQDADYTVTGLDRPKPKIKQGPPSRANQGTEHNRAKQYIIPEVVPCEFLHQLGVMTPDGKVIASKYAKFRQINRFLEIVDDVVRGYDSPTIKVVDFGCGKSYLSFALYFYFAHVRGIDAQITGLDLKSDVVAHCNALAEKIGFGGLTFRVTDVQDWHVADAAYMVVSLHACDTSTDYALAWALNSNARFILSVPCCQHELFRQVKSDVLRPMLKHGLIRERMASLITDSARANLVEAAGYSVQLVEFTDLEHTAKNILIRAVRNGDKANSRPSAADLTEYRQFADFWGIKPSLERLLDKSGMEEKTE